MIFKFQISNFKLHNTGQSIIEIVVALAIFVLIVSSLGVLIMGSFSLLARSSEFIKASALAEEGVEAVRGIRNRAWNELIYNRSGVEIINSAWSLTGEGTDEQIGNFTRVIDFLPVYRDSTGSIAESDDPGAYSDPMSKKISVSVGWDIGGGSGNSVERNTYLTNWNAKFWEQTDWIGGSGQAIWSENNMYDNDDGNINVGTAGEITLAEIATSTYASTSQIISSAFNTEKLANFIAIYWEESLPPSCPECLIKLQIKTAPDDNGAPGTWSGTWSGPDGEDGDETDFFTFATGELINIYHNSDQWIKYKAVLKGDASTTPVLEAVKLYYQ
ncbi:hypothetical protein DRH27_01960 [Candidatus Falkowbacteria bacterium]|nr:MAG: hypothetical protein DRH27_01960 [Candidatus Falkowbacteria bacterium]